MIMLDLLLTSDSLLQTLENMDRQALLAVNGSDSLYLDRVAHVLTTAITWLPLYISLFYIVLKNNDTFRKVLFIVGCAGLCVLFAGSVDDLIVKPLVGRWRPTHDPVIGTMVDVVDGYRGGRYGFAYQKSYFVDSTGYLVVHKLLDTLVSRCPFPRRYPCGTPLGWYGWYGSLFFTLLGV